MALLLAIDIGTSSAKAVLFDSVSGKTLAVATEEYPLNQPAPDRAEQNPADWWLSTVSVVGQCLEKAGRRDVSAIGLTGQMHGVTMLDAKLQVIHPSIIWADSRGAAAGKQITDLLGVERYTSISGTLPAAGFMISTLIWLEQNNADILDRTRYVLLPKDYVRFKLTGEIATDISDASATGVFDVTERTWSKTIINAALLRESIFPTLLESTAIAGRLTGQAAEALGLATGIPVVAGCADQPAQALASGLTKPGLASVTTGSGGQVCVPLRLEAGQAVPTDPRLHVFNHAIKDMHYILGAIMAAGLSLRWLRNTLGLQQQPDAYPLLSKEAAPLPPGANGLLFLPYLIGERTPHMDAQARGGFIGLRYYHERGHLARAVMEGVAFALRQTLEISLKLGKLEVTKLITAGGAMESPVWRQIQTDVFGMPMQKSLLTEQTCIGAALLAGVRTGAYTSLEEASAAVVQYDTATEPDTARHTRYNELYAQFLELYPRLRDDFHKLSS